MTAIIDNKEGLVGLVLLDESTDLQHKIQVWVIRWYCKDVRVETIVPAEACCQVLKLW